MVRPQRDPSCLTPLQLCPGDGTSMVSKKRQTERDIEGRKLREGKVPFWLRIDAFWLRIDALVDLGEGGLVKIFLFLKRGPFLFSDFKKFKNRFLLRLVVVHSLGSVISAS